MQMLPIPFTKFQNYILRPQYQQPLADLPGSHSVKTARQFLREYPLLVVLLLATMGTILLTEYVTGQAVYTSIAKQFKSPMSTWTWLLAIPLAVVLEEAAFRSVLRLAPNRLRNVAALLVFTLVCYSYHPIKEMAGENATVWIIIGWGVVTYLLDLYLKRPATFTCIDLFWQTNFHQIFYAVAGLYAFTKVIDDISTLTGSQLLLLPILLLGGLLSGFYFGYIRMTYGFWYAVAVHIFLLLASLAPEVIRIL